MKDDRDCADTLSGHGHNRNRSADRESTSVWPACDSPICPVSSSFSLSTSSLLDREETEVARVDRAESGSLGPVAAHALEMKLAASLKRSACEGGSAGPEDGRELIPESELRDGMERRGQTAWFYHDDVHNATYGLRNFKSFLQGTPGEKLFFLWMDIERLKTLQNQRCKNRLLIFMRNRYLLRSGPCALSVELLSRLDLAITPCWTEDKLYLIQPHLTETLLLYWVPRFLMARAAHEGGGVTCLRLRPPPAINTLLPLRLGLHATQTASFTGLQRTAAGQEECSTSSGVLLLKVAHEHVRVLKSGGGCSTLGQDGSRADLVLQALHWEPRAGYCFTRFCERSGDQLWKNCIQFWSDLQQYHLLFYEDGPDPFRLQRQAQLLYSTYLCSGAQTSVGLDKESRKWVYERLTTPFPELFNQAEEHALSQLLEPWDLLTARDRAFYERVDVWEETRYVDTVHYRKLRALCMKSQQRLNQSGHSPPPPPLPEVPKEPDFWAQVPDQFRGYRLGSLLRHRLELQHFHTFLEENFASMDLMCWLDIEQFRRMSTKDKTQREQKSKDIRIKYLCRKYFFGPNSPATREQQEEVMRLGGGWERILHDRLSAPMLVEVQGHVRRRIERKWLPLFLASPQFTDRQKLRSQVKDVLEDQLLLRHRKKREVWKHVECAWTASSKEMLAFRRALLNPLTCRQFQRFVSLKGDFLENGVLFWLEVQKYKDLCRSHSDEAVIQHKVSTIISCFINSSIPPALQIDIPQEQARDILGRRRELGPYVFREAQMSVFSELFKLWPQFLAFRSNVAEEQILPVLERKREKLKLRRKEEVVRRAQGEAEKQKPSLAEGLFENDGSLSEGSQEDEGTGTEKGQPVYPTKQVSWSYSKYIAALEQERALLQKCIQLEKGVASPSVSSGTVSSLVHSFKPGGMRPSRSRPSVLSTRAGNVAQ